MRRPLQVEDLSPAKRALLELRLKRREAADGAGPIRPRPAGSGPAPLSFAQQRLWVLDRLTPGLATYNVPRVMRLRGELDVDALERALDALLDRHEALRMRFDLVDGVPMQEAREAARVDLERVDLADRGAGDRESEALRLAIDAAARPFDLAADVLLRARLIRLAEDEHVLSIVTHHIVSDEGSKAIVFDDLATLYEMFRAASAPPPPRPGLQYADFAAWERDQLDGAGLADRIDWWRARLEGIPAGLDLPADRPRPPVQTGAGARHSAALDAGLVEAVHTLARRERATPFMVLLAAFAGLLARLTGEDDIPVGAPVSGRARPELEGIVGCFANTVVLRLDTSGDPSFEELVARMRMTAIDAFAHQDVPFERVVRELQPERSLDRSPLFQVMFNHFDGTAGDSAVRLAGLEVQQLEIDPGVAKFDLALVIAERTDGVVVEWEYSTDLFDPETISDVHDRFERVLGAVAARPRLKLSELPLLADAERRGLLSAFGNTAAEFPDDVCLHELIAASCARRPDAVAVESRGRSLTYGDLDRRANRLAHRLRDLGAGPDTLVGICLERSVELPIALLAVLKAGAAYVPLDPAYPSERLRLMLEDGDVPLVLTHSSLSGRLPGTRARVLDVEDELAGGPDGPCDAPPSGVGPRNLAYVIYTSGSTGRPKGVMIEHRSVVNFLTSMAKEPGVASDDVLLAVTTLSFDIAVLEIYLPLLQGARVAIASAEEANDPGRLIAAVERAGATVMQATPATWRMLVDAGWAGRPGMRILCGGEALPLSLADELLRRGSELWNLYGPTEATVWSTAGRVERLEDALAIGRPIANTEVYVLDSRLRLVPTGVPGELYIGGAGLARGYFRQPELTSERFVAHPFAADPDARLYRTGDRVRSRRDGSIEFLGRLDNQVKLRGYRIELGEVEAALMRDPGVASAVAVVRADRAGDRRLVAYVQTRSAHCDAAALQASLREQLPGYMVPSSIVPLETLPLTPNGKVDRKALPAPNGAHARNVPPRSDLEKQVAAIAAEVLGLDQIGADDDFFAVGADSLSAMRLIACVNARLGVRLPMRSAYEAPTVARLAGLVETFGEAASNEPPPVRLPRTPQQGDVAVFPASAQQQRVWYFELLEPDSALYNMPLCLRIEGALDVDVLRRSLDGLVARHEVLRTTLREHEDRLVQAIAGPGPASLAVFNVSGRPDAREHARRLAGAEAARPFDLATGPLLRALLIRIAEKEHLLCLTVHHAVADARSLELLSDELGVLYDAFLAGGAPEPASEQRIEYADYAAWQQLHAGSGRAREQLDYWRRRLEGAPRLELPADRPRSPAMSYEGGRHSFTIDGDLTEGLRELARSSGSTLFHVLAAGLDAALLAWTGQEDISIGTAVAGRARSELEDLVGYLANTVVLRTDMAGDPTFRALVGRVRDTAAGAFDNDEVPFDRVVEDLHPDRKPGRSPLFDVLLTLQSERAFAPRLGTLPVSLVEIDRGVARFDLAVSFAPRHDGLHATLEYRTALFDRATVEQFADRLAAVLAGAAHGPDRPLSQLVDVRSSSKPAAAPSREPGDGMSGLAGRIASLPPEKRALLEGALLKRVRAENGSQDEPAEAIPRRRGSGPWPLSFPQARLWFLEQLAPGLPTYNAALAMRVRGPLDLDRLGRSIEVVIERHEALRTTFPAENGTPRQEVLDEWSFQVEELDLRGTPPGARERRALEALRQVARRPFDLTRDLMLRVFACRLGDEDRALVFVEHHIAFDGWSDAALFAELEEVYGALADGREPRLPELAIQYIDFAVWQNEWMQGKVLESHRGFWRRELAGAPPHMELPTDRPRPPVQRYAGAHHHFDLPDQLGGAVRALSRVEHATPYMTLLAAFNVLLHRWSGQCDLLVGTPVANRGRVELEPLIGFFSNTLVLRAKLDGQSSFREVVRSVRRSVLAAFDHQDLPFEKVVEAVRPPRDPSRNPIFQVNFRVQSAAPPALHLPGVAIEPFDLDLGFARFDLALELQLRPDRFCGYLEYNLDLIEAETARRLADAFGALLADALARPGVPIGSLACPVPSGTASLS